MNSSFWLQMIASHTIPSVIQSELTMLGDQNPVNTFTVFDSQDITLANALSHFLSSFIDFKCGGNSMTFLVVKGILEAAVAFS